jgi:hypothetical protein
VTRPAEERFSASTIKLDLHEIVNWWACTSIAARTTSMPRTFSISSTINFAIAEARQRSHGPGGFSSMAHDLFRRALGFAAAGGNTIRLALGHEEKL